MMPGTDFKSIREAIMDAFDEDELKISLRELMDVKLNNVVGSGNFATRVFGLLEWSEREGREAELIRATAMARPRNDKMQLVYGKYGMSVPINVQKAGIVENDGGNNIGHAGLERIVRDHLSFSDFGVWRERMTAVEGQVCQIRFRGSPQGTGFLVGPNAVLTNYHVMASVLKGAVSPTDVECVFDFKKLSDGSTLSTIVQLQTTDWCVDACPFTAGESTGKPGDALPTTDELDFALLQLAEPVGAKPWAVNPGSGAPNRGWIQVPEVSPELKSPMGIMIAQHPKGWPMKLGIDTNAVNKANIPPLWVNGNGTRLRYATNTEGGSSGSPVFDLEWNLIALHHYGDPDYDQSKYNQGIPISAIRERLKRSGKLGFFGGELS